MRAQIQYLLMFIEKSTVSNNESGEVVVKDEPEWDASSIEEEERSIAEMFQHEMSVKREPDDLDIDDDGLVRVLKWIFRQTLTLGVISKDRCSTRHIGDVRCNVM